MEAAAEARRQGKAYEHLSPLAGPEKYAGGLETVYNIDAADKTLKIRQDCLRNQTSICIHYPRFYVNKVFLCLNV